MNWQRKKLEDIADFTLGKMLDEKKNRGDLLPYLANINVRWGSFDLEELREMKFEEHEKDRFGLKEGDIVMCEGGEPGRCAIWKDQNPNMMIQKALHRIRPYKDVDGRFLFYSFLHKGKAGGFAPLFTGATIKHLPKEKLAKVEVDIPPLQTQKQIAFILSAYDDLIENNRRRTQLLEESARLLYKEWFVQLRFPGYEHVKVIDGVPEGWSNKPLTEVSVVNEKTLKNGYEGEIEYVDIASVSPNAINETTWYEFKDAPGRARRVLRHKDIIWSCVRPNRRSHALVWMPHDRLIASTGFAVISAKKISPCYLYQYLTTNSYVGYLTNNAGGAAYPAVTAKVFESSEVLVPTENLQVEYEDFAENIYQGIHLLSEQNKKLAQARDILLPRLMNGELAA